MISTKKLDDGIYSIIVSGDLDLYNVTRFKEELALREKDPFVVDFGKLNYIDSTALGVLIGSHKARKENRVDTCMRIVCTNKDILKIFQITGLIRIFAISSSMDEALKGFSSETPQLVKV